jgi:N-methylhydantoinase A
MIISTDVGGTFTDYIVIDQNQIKAFKALTTSDPSNGIIDNLKDYKRTDIEQFSHGTTVAVNAVLERKGSNVIFFTTQGFSDLVQIGRQARNHVYSFICEKPTIPVHELVEISERTDANGNIIKSISGEDLGRIGEKFSNEYSVAVIGFLNSYINPDNELQAEAILNKLFPIVISSHKLRREIREYDRFCTAIIEGYCTPLVNNYLKRLANINSKFFIMQSNGGKTRPEYLKKINLLFSGPAGGVAAAQALCKNQHIENAILYDMGGTSVDISAIVNGSPLYTDDLNITGIPIKTLALDIISIGAGGGSIAWLDDAGVLKVGPQSAGSLPGPACYAQNGNDFTVSDANLLLGVLSESISGINLETDLARKAGRSLCQMLNKNIIDLSQGVIRIVNNNMVSALKNYSLSRGYDPRTFTLIAFGGAGPMHACALAEELGIKRIVIPDKAGAFSALGILNAPERFDYVRTILKPLDEAQDLIVKVIQDFIDDLKDKLGNEYQNASTYPTLDIRYFGQGHEINVSFSDGIEGIFNDKHYSIFGFNLPEYPLEVVNVKLVAELPAKEILYPKYTKSTPEIKNRREVSNFGLVDVYFKDFYNSSVKGPCIIEDTTTTVLVEGGWKADLDLTGILHLKYLEGD